MSTPEQPVPSVAAASPEGAAAVVTPVFRPTQEPEAVNLTQLAGGAVAKRLLPVVGLVVVAGIIIYVIVR